MNLYYYENHCCTNFSSVLRISFLVEIYSGLMLKQSLLYNIRLLSIGQQWRHGFMKEMQDYTQSQLASTNLRY